MASPDLSPGVMEVRIIPVIDLRAGRAVRGRAGLRDSYLPVTSRLFDGSPRDLSDPLALARLFRRRLAARVIYVADLDALERTGDNRDVLHALLRALPGTRLLWDAGLTGPDGIAGLLRGCRSEVARRVMPVIATETLRSLTTLASLSAERRRSTGIEPVLSLDLSEAGVVGPPDVAAAGELVILAAAASCGLRQAILLFLRRVGTCRGLPRRRLQRLRRAAPGLDLYAGGGVASPADIAFLRGSRFQGALVGSALHDGRIGPESLGLPVTSRRASPPECGE